MQRRLLRTTLISSLENSEFQRGKNRTTAADALRFDAAMPHDKAHAGHCFKKYAP